MLPKIKESFMMVQDSSVKYPELKKSSNHNNKILPIDVCKFN